MSAGVLERFLHAVDRAPDATAIEVVPEGRALRYRELLALVERTQGQLAALGVERGDRVVVMLPSGAELVAAIYALASLGAVAVPLSDTTTAYELGPMLALTNARGAMLGTSRALAALGSLEDDGASRLAFVLWMGEGAPPGFSRPIVHAASFAAPPRALVAPSPDTVVGCHFTYKGLGRPLGALHRYGSYGACVDGMIAAHAGAADGAHLVVLPMHPVYGLVTTMMAPLALGVRLVVSRLAAGAQLLDTLVEHRVRFACLVPPLLATLAAAARRRPEIAQRVRADLDLASGGSVLEDATAAEVHDALRREVLQGYGTTETLPVTAARKGSLLRGTLGVPIRDDVRLAILDANGAPLPPGRVGAVAVGGPTTMVGYLSDEDATRRFLVGGVFHTGDLGQLDERGRLSFVGRSLPFTKSIAQMVDLRELEDVARLHPGVADARAVAGTDARIGECVELTVRARPGVVVSPSDVTAHVRLHLSAHKVPRRVRVADEESSR